MNRRKVKLIHPGWLTAPNGANTVMNALLNSRSLFEEKGIDLTSLTLDVIVPRSFDNTSQNSKVAIWRARIKSWLKNATKFSRFACDIIIYLSDLRPSKRIVKQYIESERKENEVAFFHSLSPCYYFLKNNKTKQPAVVVLHTNGENFKMEKIYYPKLEKSLVYKKLLKMEKYVLENVSRINFVSSKSRETFINLHPEIDAGKIFYIYNGVANEIKSKRSRAESSVMEFCCVASITRRKGQHYIIDALKRFERDTMPKVHFTFVGEGTDRGDLEMDVKNNGLEEYVTFVGISHNVDDYLVNSDGFILPSDDEGLPMAIIEAMRASLPIVSTPVGGIPEMVDNEVNGLLIEPSVDAVYQLLVNLEEYDWRGMGVEARKTFVEKFTIDKMVEGYVNLLQL